MQEADGLSALELAQYRFDDQLVAYRWDYQRYQRERYAEINALQTQTADANWFLLKSNQREAPAVLIEDFKRITSIITRSDVLELQK